MKVLCAIILMVCFYLTKASPLSTRIIGGTEVAEGDIPYIVSLRVYNQHLCGGTILDETYILTAAHCVYKWNILDMTIQYGVVNIAQEGPNIIKIKNAIMHEDFDIKNPGIFNDIAILELKEKINFGPNALPVTLPVLGQDEEEINIALVSGWGLLESGAAPTHLLEAKILTFPNAYCEEKESRFDAKYQICAGLIDGGAGQCSGDSGGPLVVDGVQVGVTSWSVKPCASPENPGIYVRLSTYRLWIYLNVGI